MTVPLLKWLYRLKKPVDTKNIKVYDEVWILHNNKPVKMMVFAVIESMDYWKQGTEIHYNLVKERCGVGWGSNEGVQRSPDNIFLTKQELLDNL